MEKRSNCSKPVTLSCDLDLVSAWLSYKFRTSSYFTEANIWPKFKENPSRGIWYMERTRNSKLKPMTLTCDLDLELAWLAWVLHIDSLRRIFDQSLMKIIQRVQEILSGQESVMERQTDRWTDEGHFYNPHPLRGGGLRMQDIKQIAS